MSSLYRVTTHDSRHLTLSYFRENQSVLYGATTGGEKLLG